MADATDAGRIEISDPVPEELNAILAPGALDLVARLQRELGARRLELLARRRERQVRLDAGESLDFLPGTAAIREAEWSIAPLPADLQDRRVEITGPPERKMLINALNSGASVYMADFEDANSPTWLNCLRGQLNLRDAVQGTIEHTAPNGRIYRVNEEHAVLMARPRGWHLDERHLLIDGAPVAASLFDFGLYMFHNARTLLESGSGPYFYLPKLESHLEARLWNDAFQLAQDHLGIPQGSIRATVLIETLPAAFEMDEILYELRDHSAGLNCGRWDYIFSFIKRSRARPELVFPDRAQVTMTTHCMRSYSLLAIKTCHQRGAQAIGGMAAQIPIKNDPEANERAMAKVREDKERESRDGHDGTWVAHPGLVPIAKEIFDREMPAPNQIHRTREDVQVGRDDLLRPPEGTITEAGLRLNIDVGIRYLEAWLGGNGCVPLYHLMEDAATSEISRAQVWQWVHHPGGILEDGRKIDAAMVRALIEEEMQKMRDGLGPERFDSGNFSLARDLFERLALDAELAEFLTLAAYEHLP